MSSNMFSFWDTRDVGITVTLQSSTVTETCNRNQKCTVTETTY